VHCSPPFGRGAGKPREIGLKGPEFKRTRSRQRL
jgi:hypothetical protein